MKTPSPKHILLFTFTFMLSFCYGETSRYSFIWNGYLQESRTVELTDKQAINVAKTEYTYDSTNFSSAYSDEDFYRKVKKKNFVYANMPMYESMDFLPNETAIVKDSVLKNELIICPKRIKNAHQPVQTVYYTWQQNKWLPKTKHDIQIDTAAHSKTDTEYKWLADSGIWVPKQRKISSYPASKDTALSEAIFKFISGEFVLKNTREIIYEDGKKKEDKRTSFNLDLSIKSQSKTIYYYDDPSGYTASQQFKFNPETTAWEEKGERKIHQSKRQREKERMAEERERFIDDWVDAKSATFGDLQKIDRGFSAGKKTLREEMVFDPKTNKWTKFRIVTDR